MRTYVGCLAAARQTSDSKESETAARDLPTSTQNDNTRRTCRITPPKTAPSGAGSHTRLFSQPHPTHARKVLRSEDTTTAEARLAVARAHGGAFPGTEKNKPPAFQFRPHRPRRGGGGTYSSPVCIAGACVRAPEIARGSLRILHVPVDLKPGPGHRCKRARGRQAAD